MAIITPSPAIHGTTTAATMDSGPNTLLCQLMSNASARSANSIGSHHQSRHAHHLSYQIATQEQQTGYMGASLTVVVMAVWQVWIHTFLAQSDMPTWT